MRDLFQDKSLADIFPQVDKALPSRGYVVYSYAEMTKRVTDYIASAFGGKVQADGTLWVWGHKTQILRQIRAMHAQLEALFNSMPSITKNLRSNTPLYLPVPSKLALKEFAGNAKGKSDLLQAVLDNINYNPNFKSENTIPTEVATSFAKRQMQWQNKVGYQ